MASGERYRRRRSIRLAMHDYAGPGAYFVTICTQGRACLFGEIDGDVLQLNAAGRVVEDCWRAVPDHFPQVALDAFVIMPNHVHGILWMVDSMARVGAKDFSPLPPIDAPQPIRLPEPRAIGAPQPMRSPMMPAPPTFRSPSRTIGSVIRGFKIGVTKWARTNTDIHDVWQRTYYEHLIRDEVALRRIRQYIADNPGRWIDDAEDAGHHGHRGRGVYTLVTSTD